MDPADSTPPRTTDHPFDRQASISERLRERIINAELVPGERLASRQELIRHFRTTAMTVQKALSRLEREGFVESRGWEGTFVAQAPPHLFRYGLIIPRFPGGHDAMIQRFASTLWEVASASARQRPRRLSVYANIRGEMEAEEDMLRLTSDLDHRCLAGMILTDRYTLENAPVARLMKTSNVPKVVLFGEPIPHGAVRVRLEPFWGMAAEHLVKRGAKRVGFVFLDNAAGSYWNPAVEAMTTQGLATRLWWRIDVNGRHLPGIRPALQMMLHLPKAERPDALVITDDSLVPAVTEALVEAGASDAMDVVAHANFPIVTPSAVPAARIGYDAREILRTCADTIDLLRTGREVGSPGVAARWEGEVENQSTDGDFLNGLAVG